MDAQGWRRSKMLLVAFCAAAAALVLPSPLAPPATAALRPAPGTGHGVLGGTTPSKEFGSLEYAPGLGAGPCRAEPRQVEVSVLTYRRYRERVGVVGLPVSLCIGRLPNATMDVTITPPDGRTITLPSQVVESGELGVSIDILVLPSPPSTRYRVSDGGGRLSTGRLEGDGSGTYAVRVQGGASTRTSFELEPAPKPRLMNAVSMHPTVTQGGRLRFGAAGEAPLQTFQVAIFGPYSARSSGLPLRTVIVARADSRGEAIVTLDVLSTSVAGTGYVAMLNPKTTLADPTGLYDGLDPRLAMFEVAAR
jgi:hypothetical protein